MILKTSVIFLPYVTQTIRYYNTVWWRFSLLHILLIQNIAKCSLLLKSFFSNMCFDICNNSCHVLFLPFACDLRCTGRSCLLLKPLYSAFNTSALSIAILSILTTWHILGKDGNICNALKSKLNVLTNFNLKIVLNEFLSSKIWHNTLPKISLK